MSPEIRRIIVVDAHHRRTGRYPLVIHSMGTGESFDIAAGPDGFVDLASGVEARSGASAIDVAGHGQPITILGGDDVTLHGYEPGSAERFTARASGGVSVTLFTGAGPDAFQFAIAEAE